jgi:hypothetical protein
MAVDISGFDREVKTFGIVHSSGEKILFAIEEEPPRGTRTDSVLRFFGQITAPLPENTPDFLYFSVQNSTQRISFSWGSDPQKPLTWSGALTIPPPLPH